MSSNPEISRIDRMEVKRVGKFGIVGALNTLIDFGVYNLLSGKIGFTLIQSNVVSTTVAMAFSFFANRHVVFKKKHDSLWRQAIIFFAVTAFGLYVLQTGTILLLTDIWPWPLQTCVAIIHTMGLKGHDQFLIKNSAKGIATIISLTWNYFTYKKVVFN